MILVEFIRLQDELAGRADAGLSTSKKYVIKQEEFFKYGSTA